MKIKTIELPLEKVLKIAPPKHKNPKRPNLFFRSLIRLLSIPELMATKFSFTSQNMERAGNGPYLILMNHSCFVDLKIAYKIFFPHPFCVVCTSDGFIGKPWLMRQIGSIPTTKFITDLTLVRDMLYTANKLNTSILMYPEASYSFDGCATPLPKKLGIMIKKLNLPVVTVITDGAFLHNPLYGGLKQRRVKITARLDCLLSKEDIQKYTAEEIDCLLKDTFSFDNFKNQFDNKVLLTEDFRAEGLHRMLYKCPACKEEGKMLGAGTKITCSACQKEYYMDELGRLSATEGETEFPHIPDWYAWQRSEVKKELLNGNYRMDTDVDISVMRDYKAVYKVGEGRLVHTENGFSLTGCDGRLEYRHSPTASYGLYADYYWYEIGDVICIGNKETLYYCFPKKSAIVAKARLAAEELYKLKKANIKNCEDV